MAGVVAFGLLWARAEVAVERLAPHYPPEVPDYRLRFGLPPSEWLVDGFNFLHAVLLGGRDRSEWWTGERRAEVLELAGTFDRGDAELWVVFDGPPERCGETRRDDGVHEVFAESADDWLVARVRAADQPSRVAVVTADRPLVRRLERCGARVVPPDEFAQQCRDPAPAGIQPG
jgi:hypothetical protein